MYKFTKNIKIVNIQTEFITLSQFLKFVGLIGNGGETKDYLQDHKILLDGKLVFEKRKKIYTNSELSIDNKLFFKITKGVS